MEIIQKWVGGYDKLMYVLCVVAVIPVYNIWILNKKIKEVSGKNKVNNERKRIEEEFGGTADAEKEVSTPAPFVEEDEEALV